MRFLPKFWVLVLLALNASLVTGESLKEKLTYKDFQELLVHTVNRIPELHEVWLYRSRVQRDDLYLHGGAIRGTLDWLYQKLQTHTPEEVRELRPPHIADVIQPKADLDLLSLSEVDRKDVPNAGPYYRWDIIDREFHEMSINAGGTTLEKSGVGPQGIYDPTGGIRDFYDGKLVFQHDPDRPEAMSIENGTTGTVLGMRYTRFLAEFPYLSAPEESRRHLRLIAEKEIGIFTEKYPLSRYQVQKAMGKLLIASDHQLLPALLKLKEIGLLSVVGDDRLQFRDGALEGDRDAAWLVKELRSAGFDWEEVHSARRTLRLNSWESADFVDAMVKEAKTFSDLKEITRFTPEKDAAELVNLWARRSERGNGIASHVPLSTEDRERMAQTLESLQSPVFYYQAAANERPEDWRPTILNIPEPSPIDPREESLKVSLRLQQRDRIARLSFAEKEKVSEAVWNRLRNLKGDYGDKSFIDSLRNLTFQDSINDLGFQQRLLDYTLSNDFGDGWLLLLSLSPLPEIKAQLEKEMETVIATPKKKLSSLAAQVWFVWEPSDSHPISTKLNQAISDAFTDKDAKRLAALLELGRTKPRSSELNKDIFNFVRSDILNHGEGTPLKYAWFRYVWGLEDDGLAEQTNLLMREYFKKEPVDNVVVRNWLGMVKRFDHEGIRNAAHGIVLDQINQPSINGYLVDEWQASGLGSDLPIKLSPLEFVKLIQNTPFKSGVLLDYKRVLPIVQGSVSENEANEIRSIIRNLKPAKDEMLFAKRKQALEDWAEGFACPFGSLFSKS